LGIGIAILASDISVRYRNIPVPDCFLIFWYWTGYSIASFFYSVIIQYGRVRAENNMLSLIRKELRDSWI
jgi:hypothetical protein